MDYLGDIRIGDTLDFKFTTKNAALVPTTLVGGVISAYVGNSTTELTAGITLTVNFDGITGLHNVRVVASLVNGYAAGTNVDLVATVGTVDGVSFVGTTIGSFSIANRVVDVVVDAPTVQDLVDGIYDEPRSAHVIAGSFGQGVASVVGAVGSVTGAVGSVTGNVGGNVAGSVASVTANVNADIKKINGTTVVGNGAGTPWGP